MKDYMQYIDHGQGGPASCMQIKQAPVPQLKSGEVLIEVAYAGRQSAGCLPAHGSVSATARRLAHSGTGSCRKDCRQSR